MAAWQGLAAARSIKNRCQAVLPCVSYSAWLCCPARGQTLRLNPSPSLSGALVIMQGYNDPSRPPKGSEGVARRAQRSRRNRPEWHMTTEDARCKLRRLYSSL